MPGPAWHTRPHPPGGLMGLWFPTQDLGPLTTQEEARLGASGDSASSLTALCQLQRAGLLASTPAPHTPGLPWQSWVPASQDRTMCCPCFGVSNPAPLPSRLTGSPHHPGVRLLLDFSHPALSQLPGPAREGLAWPLAIAWQGHGCEDTPPHQVSVPALQGVHGAVGVGHLLASEDPPTACLSLRATASCSGWLVKHGAHLYYSELCH